MKIKDIIEEKYKVARKHYETRKHTTECSYYMGYMDALSELLERIELEEDKKIPEKINNGYTKQSIVDMKEARFNSNDMAKICNRIGWLMENRNELSNKIDEIIDYLKSKGDE